MTRHSLRGLFVTGSDTGIGKTRVAAAIISRLRAEGIRVGAYKPTVSGADRDNSGRSVWDDVVRLREALEKSDELVPDDWISPQRFIATLAPHLAARAEDREVDERLLEEGVDVWRGRVEAVVVEGAGGLLSPLSENLLNADLAARWMWPVVIVSRRGLGAINQALLTVEAARARGLTIAAIVLNAGRLDGLNDLSVLSNARELARWVPGIPVLETGFVPDGDLRNDPAFLTIQWNVLMSGPSAAAPGEN